MTFIECLVASSRSQRKTASATSWPGAFEYSVSPFLVPDGDLNGALKGDGKPDFGVTTTRLIQPLLGCPQPDKVSGSLVYLRDAREPMTLFPVSDSQEGVTFPHGAEVRFDCLPAEPTGPLPGDDDYEYYYDEESEDYEEGEAEYDEEEEDEDTTETPSLTTVTSNTTKPLMRSWKIMCLNGRWQGRAGNCDGEGRPILDHESAASKDHAEVSSSSSFSSPAFNASCPFPERGRPLESNMAVFHGDRQLSGAAKEGGGEVEEEQFEPGAELVYRCVDIGKRGKEREKEEKKDAKKLGHRIIWPSFSGKKGLSFLFFSNMLLLGDLGKKRALLVCVIRDMGDLGCFFSFSKFKKMQRNEKKVSSWEHGGVNRRAGGRILAGFSSFRNASLLQGTQWVFG